jgi:hypothetical protein
MAGDGRKNKTTAKLADAKIAELATRSATDPDMRPTSKLSRDALLELLHQDASTNDTDERKRVHAKLLRLMPPVAAPIGSARMRTTGAIDPVLKPRLVEVSEAATTSGPAAATEAVTHEDLASAALVEQALAQLHSGEPLDPAERAFLEKLAGRRVVRRPASTTIEVATERAARITTTVWDPTELDLRSTRSTSPSEPAPRDPDPDPDPEVGERSFLPTREPVVENARSPMAFMPGFWSLGGGSDPIRSDRRRLWLVAVALAAVIVLLAMTRSG